MGRVECISIPGLELLFFSGDHGPPHFHVLRKGAWEIRVFFLNCTWETMIYDVKWLKRSVGPSRKIKKRILEQVMENQIELAVEWESKVLGTSSDD